VCFVICHVAGLSSLEVGGFIVVVVMEVKENFEIDYYC